MNPPRTLENAPGRLASGQQGRARGEREHAAHAERRSTHGNGNGARASERTIRVLIADGDPLARRAIRDVLQEEDDFVVSADAVDGREATELALHYQPDLVLAALELPVQNGVETTARIISGAPGTRVILLSMNTDIDVQLEALRAGACGYLKKSIDPTALPRVLRSVMSGEAAIMRETTMHLVERLRAATREEKVRLRPIRSPLTTREWEVLDLLTQGASTEEIAERLVLTLDTVYSHVKHILRKLGVHSRAEAIEVAERLRNGEPVREDEA